MALGNVDAPRARFCVIPRHTGVVPALTTKHPKLAPGGKRHNQDSSPAWFFLLRGLLYMFHVGAGHCY